ncbi:DUF2505 domain-containing protein [Salinisphaera hydrothermalis]|uniref:DUF2505 domain-containing protein n=1 Tax=Salinisphaera hydrothermalis (strain C41B8) TaxID=1304275 RepID=A0A084IGI2_SALHC|nr:DUF2505 domain-containing protein [Salinisphaera hydrothermalis]KEZ75816.1 hypothetical protein C41B8_18010 [Salinisphaera hydrothermalis C41B8]
MKFQETFDFDYPAEIILRMFGDKDYYLAKYEKMGGEAPEVLSSESGDARFSITVRHALDASRLKFPDFVKSRIGDQLYLRQTDAWQLDAGEGRLDIEIERAPVEIGSRLNLTDAGNGSRLVLDFNIKASVPLVGGKIEKAVAGPISRHVQKDLTLTNRMAADYA